MFSSNVKNFLFIAIFTTMLCSSCSFWQGKNEQKVANDVDSVGQTNIPFPTKEPEIFQADIIVSTFINGNKTERKTFTAHKKDKSLQTFNADSDSSRSILRLGDETFLLNHKAKSYRKVSSEQSQSFSDNSLVTTLTSKWLNEKHSSKFTKLNTEGSLTKYRVNVEDEKTTEAVVSVDEKFQMPIKLEFYKTANDKKDLTYSIELKNIKTDVNDKLFELPKDYKEIN